MSFDLKLQDGDLRLSANKDLATVENTEKLTQDILKIVSTPLGSNSFFPWYGSPIDNSLIGSSFETTFVDQVVSTQLRTSLETLQKMQEEQLATTQTVTPQEQIAAISNVRVERNTVDPRFFAIAITVLSKAFRRVQTSLTLRP